jgi:hypothetical protein
MREVCSSVRIDTKRLAIIKAELQLTTNFAPSTDSETEEAQQDSKKKKISQRWKF